MTTDFPNTTLLTKEANDSMSYSYPNYTGTTLHRIMSSNVSLEIGQSLSTALINMEVWTDTTAHENSTRTLNTTVIPADGNFTGIILDWFLSLALATRIVIISLACLVLVLLIGIISCCCCCKRGRCKTEYRRNNAARAHSGERHYTLPNQMTRLSKLRQNFTRRISSLWLDREVADGESLSANRIPHNSPRKDRNVRMPSPTADRPYMDMSCLTKAHKEIEVRKHPDDHDSLSSKGYVKPDRKMLPPPPPKPHQKLQNTDGKGSVRLKNNPNVMVGQGYNSPRMPVKYTVVPTVSVPAPYSTCQQCSMGHYGPGCSAIVQMPIQQPHTIGMYNNQMYMPEDFAYGPNRKHPHWTGDMEHTYYHGNIAYGQSIPEVEDYGDESDSGVPQFEQDSRRYRQPSMQTHNQLNPNLENKTCDKALVQEPLYSDVTELHTGANSTSTGEETQRTGTHDFKASKKYRSVRMSMDLK